MTATAMNTVRIGDMADALTDGRTASDCRAEPEAPRQFKGLSCVRDRARARPPAQRTTGEGEERENEEEKRRDA